MKSFLILFTLFVAVSCGKNGEDGTNGIDGTTFAPLNPVISSFDLKDIEPGLACADGGVSIVIFQDSNMDGIHQDDELITKTKSICHGSNASITLESVAASSTCPSGGVVISSSTASGIVVCNGINGLNGLNGANGTDGKDGIDGTNGSDGKDGVDGTNGSDGKDGINGTNGKDGVNGTSGTNGSSVIPVKFCQTDNSAFPEYGLLIGGELFAVYWDPKTGSAKKEQAFLTKLDKGKYQSTGGNNCLFEVK